MKFKSSITQLENLREHLTSTMKQAEDEMPGCEAKSQDLVKINKIWIFIKNTEKKHTRNMGPNKQTPLQE